MVHVIENNRQLLLQIDEKRKALNQEIIDPMVPDLKIEDLTPIIKLVAQIRGTYLKELFDISSTVGDGTPTQEQIQRLRGFRIAYEEFVAGSQALETAIERGYLKVEEK